MMLATPSHQPTFVTVTVALRQSGQRVEGRWSSTEASKHLLGDATGTILKRNGQYQIDLSVSFRDGSLDRRVSNPADCRGVARASGQLTYVTTRYTDARPDSQQGSHWAIRLKAFDGIGLGACGAIPYATWTLTRAEQSLARSSLLTTFLERSRQSPR
ncbi:MAG TPA: hypothetical protein VGQ37_15645 [Vicinamibacterales bacterium]|jgi:hypothetical protein|nr:hypothetical protein [Vicinamibacterales bacterium]